MNNDSRKPQRRLNVLDSLMQTGVERRTLLKGAALSLLTTAACNRVAPEKLIPYVTTPPEEVPGRSTQYATTILRGGYGLGIVAECYGGRPVKLDGNPKHPASLGALDVVGQALLHQLYDPDRAQHAQAGDRVLPSENEFFEHWQRFIQEKLPKSGRGLGLVVDATSSLTQLDALRRLHTRFPEARFFVDSYAQPSAGLEASQRAFGQSVDPVVELDEARVLLCIDDDAFLDDCRSLRWGRQVGPRIGTDPGDNQLLRLFVAEPSLTATGMLADDRLALSSASCGALLLQLLVDLSRRLSLATFTLEPGDAARSLRPHELSWTGAVADALLAHRKHAWVLVGAYQPWQVQVLGLAVNELLRGKLATRPHSQLHPASSPLPLENGSELAVQLSRSQIQALVTTCDNPLWSWPGADELVELHSRVPLTVHSGYYLNETAERSGFFVPRAHELESFDAQRAFDGTISLSQPLIRPLIPALGTAEFLAQLSGDKIISHDHITQLISQELDKKVNLDAALRHGFVQGTAFDLQSLELKPDVIREAMHFVAAFKPQTLELLTRPEKKLAGGSLANSALLQELPDPVTKLVWNNALLVAPITAKEQGLTHFLAVRLSVDERSILLPVLVEESQAEGVLSVALGYGRTAQAESTACGIGVDVGPLRSRSSAWEIARVKVEPSAVDIELARTQHEFSDHERNAAISATLDEFHADSQIARRHAEPPDSILPDYPSEVRQWGMSIDLSRCMGCNACVIACQVENSVPTVGPAQARLGRTMHWMRIDRYEKKRAGQVVHVCQPMACQHCEKAPCEYVCPVGATTHSPDGLNEMTYNRCVGTRYCSNNCPYKVRRFNFLSHDEELSESRKMEKNPNVTVRARGVMEKCTYCVQRIRRAEIDARLQHLPREAATVVTACQQTCPTSAISFGSVSDPNSEVSRSLDSPRTYAALNDVGARPRTRYLARLDRPLDRQAKKEIQ